MSQRCNKYEDLQDETGNDNNTNRYHQPLPSHRRKLITPQIDNGCHQTDYIDQRQTLHHRPRSISIPSSSPTKKKSKSKPLRNASCNPPNHSHSVTDPLSQLPPFMQEALLQSCRTKKKQNGPNKIPTNVAQSGVIKVLSVTIV